MNQTTSTSICDRLCRRAASGALEVEDLLATVQSRDPGLAPPLRALARELGWDFRSHVGGARVVPLGRWVEVVASFHEGAYAALERLCAGQDGNSYESFVLAALEALKTPEAVMSVVRVLGSAAGDPLSNLALAAKGATALNLLLSFKPAPTLSPTLAETVRQFLHRLLACPLQEPQRATTVLALRGVGDKTTLALLADVPAFEGPWSGTLPLTKRVISRRLRSDAQPVIPAGAPKAVRR